MVQPAPSEGGLWYRSYKHSQGSPEKSYLRNLEHESTI